MENNIIKVNFTKDSEGEKYINSLKEITKAIKDASLRFDVEVRDYFQDLNYLIVAEDIKDHLDSNK